MLHLLHVPAGKEPHEWPADSALHAARGQSTPRRRGEDTVPFYEHCLAQHLISTLPKITSQSGDVTICAMRPATRTSPQK
jgi:hypothetical protein